MSWLQPTGSIPATKATSSMEPSLNVYPVYINILGMISRLEAGELQDEDLNRMKAFASKIFKPISIYFKHDLKIIPKMKFIFRKIECAGDEMKKRK